MAIVGGVAIWKFKPPEPKQVTRFEYQLLEGQQFNQGLAVSPDGSKFVYQTNEGLYLRFMDALDARLVSGTDKDSVQPFFSPDGQWIGYISASDQKLKKVAISGAAPVVLCDIGVLVYGASWYPEDTIVYSDLISGIMRVSSNGGTPETLIKTNLGFVAKEGFPIAPQMLLDG